MMPRIAPSTGELMRLVALAAANLVLFQGVGMTLIYAPVAITAVTVNLGLCCTLVRPRTLNRGIVAAMAGGLCAALAAVAYLAECRLKPLLALALLDSLPHPLYQSLPASTGSRSGAWFLDFALLDALSLAAMLACGWLAWPRPRARDRSKPTRSGAASPSPDPPAP